MWLARILKTSDILLESMNKHYTKGFVALAVVAFFATSCSHEHPQGVMETIHTQTVVQENRSGEADSNWNAIVHEGHTFFTLPRREEMKRYDCRECHTASMKTMASSDEQQAHWDVKLNHAFSDIMDCATCHGHGDASTLISINGTQIEYDNSHLLCGQCHSNQLNDWYGGAHGKKLSGWKTPRVSKTCVECHDPHKPGFDQRMPARYNTQKVEERK